MRDVEPDIDGGPFDPHVVVRLQDRVRRVTAPNPGTMTGPGTNCYLIGESEVAVIDTGVDDPAHIQRLVDAAPGPIRWILITHTHPDHSRGSRLLADLTGAPILAHPVALRGVRDEDFQADGHIDEGDIIRGPDFTLRVLHTPGHAANHLCYLLEDTGLLFAGDHVMADVTVVIAPPDGDMRAYLDSLERLKREPLHAVAPAHGRVLEAPGAVLRQITDHRLARERDVVAALAEHSAGCDIGVLVRRIYTHIPASLHPMAARSVHAHLLKLAADGRARCDRASGTWRSV